MARMSWPFFAGVLGKQYGQGSEIKQAGFTGRRNQGKKAKKILGCQIFLVVCFAHLRLVRGVQEGFLLGIK